MQFRLKVWLSPVCVRFPPMLHRLRVRFLVRAVRQKLPPVCKDGGCTVTIAAPSCCLVAGLNCRML